MEAPKQSGFSVTVSRVTVFIMKYGADVISLHTLFHPDPLNFEGSTDNLDLTFRAPRMKGEAYVREQWPDAEVTVQKWNEKTVYVK